MLRRSVVGAGISLAALVAAYGVGCGTTVEGGTDGDGDQTGEVPPAPPADAPTGDGPGYVYAINKLYLGDTTRSGASDPNAWKDYGYNLDAKISTKESTDLCQPSSGGAPSSVYPDGTDGIDNSFGHNLLPIITGLAPDAGQQINDELAQGSFTIMIRIDELGSGANYIDLPASLYAGDTLDTVPKFDGTDEWPVVPELLDNPDDIDSSKVKFNSSYVNTNTWVSGTDGTVELSLAVQGFALALTINKAVITMDLDSDRGGATNGTIAGILNTEELISELQKVAGSFDTGLCEGTTFDSLADQLRQASDVLASGGHNPSETCDGISIGLGFDAGLVNFRMICRHEQVNYSIVICLLIHELLAVVKQ